jgi:hypothetical protein
MIMSRPANKAYQAESIKRVAAETQAIGPIGVNDEEVHTILSALKQLENMIGYAHENFGDLQHRLNPVLKEEIVSAEEGNYKMASSQSLIRERLYVCADRISALDSRINYTNSIVDLP